MNGQSLGYVRPCYKVTGKRFDDRTPKGQATDGHFGKRTPETRTRKLTDRETSERRKMDGYAQMLD